MKKEFERKEFERKEFENFLISCKKNVLKMSKNGGCFIGSAFSCLDVIAYLYKEVFDVEKIKKKEKDRDILILSKGHAVAGLYAVLAEVNIISKERLDNYLTNNDDLYWHPNLNVSGIEFHTGSMGHGLSIGVGMALASRLSKIDNKIIVIVGDGELNEGSMWESVLIANAYNLKNLIVVIDRNRRQANVTTEELIPLDSLTDKFSSFGWITHSCNGHDVQDISDSFENIFNDSLEKPRVLVANTVRGKGIPLIEDNPKYWFGNFEKAEIDEFNKVLDSQKHNEEIE